MLPEPIRWSHATGKRVVPSPWQMTPSKGAVGSTLPYMAAEECQLHDG